MKRSRDTSIVSPHFYLPVQVTPLPVYPTLQLHEKLSSVSIHSAFIEQLSISRRHSSITETSIIYACINFSKIL